MKNILILGAGTGGTIVANLLAKNLNGKCKITVIDRSDKHYYQPGFLFVSFGLLQMNDCIRPSLNYMPFGVELLKEEILEIDPNKKIVKTDKKPHAYDILVIASGTETALNLTEGLADSWNKTVFSFYTSETAETLRTALEKFDSGKLVVHICEFPIKCSGAPFSFAFLADEYFKKRGIREKVTIEFVTPLPEPFTKPNPSKVLTEIAAKKGVKFTTSFDTAKIDSKNKFIESHDGKKIQYDLLVTIPPYTSAKFLLNSKIADESGYIPVDKNSLKVSGFDNIYALGDTVGLPISKTASAAHFQAKAIAANIERELNGMKPLPLYDGKTICYAVTGYNEAIVIEYAYDRDPDFGKFPMPFFGPVSLLASTKLNYLVKYMTKWLYYNIWLRGEPPFIFMEE